MGVSPRAQRRETPIPRQPVFIDGLMPSVGNGFLNLADATVTDDAADIITSVAQTHNGIHVVAKNSAAATINTIANSATIVWPIQWNLMGRRIEGPLNLSERPHGVGLLMRYTSLPPCLLTCFVGFAEQANVKGAQQMMGIEYGWPSTTVQRCGYFVVDGGALTRTVGAGVADEHMGAIGRARTQTHEIVGQGRVYPIGMDGLLSEAPGVNAQSSAVITTEMNAATHFFLAINWNSVAGANGLEIVVDPSYFIAPYLVPN